MHGSSFGSVERRLFDVEYLSREDDPLTRGVMTMAWCEEGTLL